MNHVIVVLFARRRAITRLGAKYQIVIVLRKCFTVFVLTNLCSLSLFIFVFVVAVNRAWQVMAIRDLHFFNCRRSHSFPAVFPPLVPIVAPTFHLKAIVKTRCHLLSYLRDPPDKKSFRQSGSCHASATGKWWRTRKGHWPDRAAHGVGRSRPQYYTSCPPPVGVFG